MVPNNYDFKSRNVKIVLFLINKTVKAVEAIIWVSCKIYSVCPIIYVGRFTENCYSNKDHNSKG